MHQSENINSLWRNFNEVSSKLSLKLGTTNNIVGEYGKHLAFRLYGGKLLECSSPSSDLLSADGQNIQVKTRKRNDLSSTVLSIIMSWDFDLLVVFMFNQEGEVLKALEIPASLAKEYAAYKDYEKGWVITTSIDFINDVRFKDITTQTKEIMSNENFIERLFKFFR